MNATAAAPIYFLQRAVGLVAGRIDKNGQLLNAPVLKAGNIHPGGSDRACRWAGAPLETTDSVMTLSGANRGENKVGWQGLKQRRDSGAYLCMPRSRCVRFMEYCIFGVQLAYRIHATARVTLTEDSCKVRLQ